MKGFLFACTACVVAVSVSAAPDELGQLMDPKVVVSTIGETVAQATAAPETAEEKNVPETKQGSSADRTRLLNNLFSGYNKKVNPDSVVLKFGISLIDFNVCEKRNVLESYVWLRYEWEDSRLKWDPVEYGGAEVIRLDSSEIWKPDVTLYDSADPVKMVNCWESNVVIWPNGKILWVPPCKMTSQCHYTLNKEPYGEQKCNLKFGSWTFDGFVVDLQLYNQTAAFDLSDINNSSGFEVVSTSVERRDQYYPCCTEPYPNINFNMTIKRIPGEELFKRM